MLGPRVEGRGDDGRRGEERRRGEKREWQVRLRAGGVGTSLEVWDLLASWLLPGCESGEVRMCQEQCLASVAGDFVAAVRDRWAQGRVSSGLVSIR